MKETIINIKKVYQYGKEYKKNLIGMIFAAFFFTRRNSKYFQRGTMKKLQIRLGKEILKISQIKYHILWKIGVIIL